MIKWFKQLFHIVKHFDDIVDSMTDLGRNQVLLRHHVDEAVQTIKDRTTLHADVHMHNRNPSQIILIGRYRNRDYIRMFEVEHDSLEGLIRQCTDMEKYAHMGRIDAFPDVKQIINTESARNWGPL